MRKSIVIATVFVASLYLSACETTYEGAVEQGNVQATRISSDTFQVVANGTEFDDPATIQRFTLRKAAETTLASGYDLFVMGESKDVSKRSNSSFGSAEIDKKGKTAFGSGFEQEFVAPGEIILVRMLKGPKPANAPANMYDAREVVNYLSTSR